MPTFNATDTMWSKTDFKKPFFFFYNRGSHTLAKTLTQKPSTARVLSSPRRTSNPHTRHQIKAVSVETVDSRPVSSLLAVFQQHSRLFISPMRRHYNTVNTLKIRHSAVWHNLGHTDQPLCREAWLQINLESLCRMLRRIWWLGCVQWRPLESWWCGAAVSKALIIICLLASPSYRLCVWPVKRISQSGDKPVEVTTPAHMRQMKTEWTGLAQRKISSDGRSVQKKNANTSPRQEA